MRGLPVREVLAGPLTLRMLFEVYAPQPPAPEIDAAGLYERHWERRVRDDARHGADGHTVPHSPDLSWPAQSLAHLMLHDAAVALPVADAAGRLPGANPEAGADDPLELLVQPDRRSSVRSFNQTLFEYAAGRYLLCCLRPEPDPQDAVPSGRGGEHCLWSWLVNLNPNSASSQGNQAVRLIDALAEHRSEWTAERMRELSRRPNAIALAPRPSSAWPSSTGVRAIRSGTRPSRSRPGSPSGSVPTGALRLEAGTSRTGAAPAARGPVRRRRSGGRPGRRWTPTGSPPPSPPPAGLPGR
ncbi:hypothetical protein ABZW32_18090 [Streptomyces sp. NPDC004667]|uniref:hypothetical protein n=1 Tax=Streptomyces sp. NPDC004667 TaxID=3154285 RepID=UPI0033AC9AC2